MAKPAYIQTLEKGKLLTGDNFPAFTETWNYVANRIENMKGDRDANPETGHITIDNSDPDHPIVRYVGKDPKDGGGETGVRTIVGEYDSTAISGDVQAAGAEGSGLMVTTAEDGEGGVLEIDVADRFDDEEYGGREITVNDEVVAKVFGTTDFELTQKTISAGKGITVSEADDIITISTTDDSQTSGYTGSRTVVVDVDYNGHYLRKKFATEEWKDGLLQSTTPGEWENYHTAVEETV